MHELEAHVVSITIRKLDEWLTAAFNAKISEGFAGRGLLFDGAAAQAFASISAVCGFFFVGRVCRSESG